MNGQVRADPARRRAERPRDGERRRPHADCRVVEGEPPVPAPHAARELEGPRREPLHADPRTHPRGVRSRGVDVHVDPVEGPERAHDPVHLRGDSADGGLDVDVDAVLRRREPALELERAGQRRAEAEVPQRRHDVRALHARFEVGPSESEGIANPPSNLDLRITEATGQRLLDVVAAVDLLESAEPALDLPRCLVELPAATEFDHPGRRIEPRFELPDAERHRRRVRTRPIDQLEPMDRRAIEDDRRPSGQLRTPARPRLGGEPPVPAPLPVRFEQHAGVLDLQLANPRGARPQRHQVEDDRDAPGPDHRRLGPPRGVRQGDAAGREPRGEGERYVERAADLQFSSERPARGPLEGAADPLRQDDLRAGHDRRDRGARQRDQDPSAALGHRRWPRDIMPHPAAGRSASVREGR